MSAAVEGSPLTDPAGPLSFSWMGRLPYARGLELQHALRDARIAGAIGDTVLLLEHDPVYTRGRRATPDELPFGTDWYAERGIEVIDVRRGGKVTYHGPGQLVAYVIAATGDVIRLVRLLEQAMITVATDRGIAARGRSDEGIEFTGVWVQQRKLGSIGLHLSRGVTTHGVGLNVVTDLEPFGWIVPCGLTTPMTSVARETNAPDLATDPALDGAGAVRTAGEAFVTALAAELAVPTVAVPAASLLAHLATPSED